MQRAVVLDAHICDHPMSPFKGHIHVLYFMEKSVTELKIQEDKEAELSDICRAPAGALQISVTELKIQEDKEAELRDDPFATSNEESNDGIQHSK